MPRLRIWCLLILFGAGPASAAEQVDYERDIKPILSGKCFACHGSLKQESELRLDTATLALHGGASGAAIVPGKPEESLLLLRVRGAEGHELMPPEGEGERVNEQQLTLLTNWIAQGATAPEEPVPPDPREHWAYQLPARPQTPQTIAPWVRNPIDSFLAQGHAEQGFVAVEPADKLTLLRRVSLDLTGLPPTREEIKAFLADNSAEAYEKVVDGLLASPRYGERWGRHWMDVWRYSDWSGFGDQLRNSQRHIWQWRDWIVESLNADKPYDRMIVEMLAADEIAPTDPKALRATGFLARNWFLFNRNTWLEATVEHTSKAFLGTTINCAKCHDHKFDPLTQKEFYQLRAIFEPYNVRTDRVPGEADPLKAGLPRIYDANPETPTYLFIRGSEIAPDKEHPLTSGVPKVLGGRFEMAPVKLPPASYYPYLADFIVQETLAAAEDKVRVANEALTVAKTAREAAAKKLAEFVAAEAVAANTADKKPAPADAAALEALLDGAQAEKPKAAPPGEKAALPPTKASLEAELVKSDTAIKLCEQQILAAQAGAAFAKAQIAAEQAAHTEPPASDAQALALVAGRAERELAWRNAEVVMLTAQQKRLAAEQSGAADDPKVKDAVTKSQAEVDAAAKTVETAKAAVEPASEKYTGLGTPFPKESTGRRTALARWIADRQNPLTARVAVNHIWLRHVGSPLVDNVFDFGLRSPKPRHAALLDFLAVELMDSGWSMKHVHRLIVTSGYYRLTSRLTGPAEANVARDPDNHWLWRMNSRRLEAEAVRDSVLYVAGNLDQTLGGPDIDFREGLTVPRRSIYFRHANDKQMKFLELFDAANVTECYRRSDSIVPQQALALANSSLALAQARLLAQKLTAESTAGQAAATASEPLFIQLAFEQILSRPPSAAEVSTCQTFLTAQSALLADPSKLTLFTSSEKAAVPPAADPPQRARENLIHVLLNHNDFVTIR